MLPNIVSVGQRVSEWLGYKVVLFAFTDQVVLNTLLCTTVQQVIITSPYGLSVTMVILYHVAVLLVYRVMCLFDCDYVHGKRVDSCDYSGCDNTISPHRSACEN